MDRRQFIAASTACLALSRSSWWMHQCAWAEDAETHVPCGLVDSNAYLFSWPFRQLKYDTPERLRQKLRAHCVQRAWVASFQAVWHKQLDRCNRQLAAVCRKFEEFFVPFGTVNPTWPDWREDLRRCCDEYRMPGIRLFPGYHGYQGGESELVALLEEATRRGLLVQIAIKLEDNRVHHPATAIQKVDLPTLSASLARVPQARVQLLQADEVLHSPVFKELLELPHLVFDISSLEGQAGLRRVLDGNLPQLATKVPIGKLLFGSHAPLFPVESAVWKLFESELSKDEAIAIMRQNALNWSTR